MAISEATLAEGQNERLIPFAGKRTCGRSKSITAQKSRKLMPSSAVAIQSVGDGIFRLELCVDAFVYVIVRLKLCPSRSDAVQLGEDEE